MIFFTADTHFSHARIIELCNRPFDDINHMDEMMIKNWNKTVAPGDTVFHLGDVALGTIAGSLPKVGRLNGYKALIPGNHDRIFSEASQAHRDRFMPEYLKVFDKVLDEIQTFTYEAVPRPERTMLLCHFPYCGDSHVDDRFGGLRPKDTGLPLIHGHVHSEWRTNGRQFNVGVDVNDYRPVSIDTIMEWIDTL